MKKGWKNGLFREQKTEEHAYVSNWTAISDCWKILKNC